MNTDICTPFKAEPTTDLFKRVKELEELLDKKTKEYEIEHYCDLLAKYQRLQKENEELRQLLKDRKKV